MKYDLLCIGELLIDFVEQDERRDLTALYQANAGGAPGNVACTGQRFGLNTGFIGAVGDDAFGRLLIDALQTYEVDTRGIQMLPNVMTTLAFVSLGAEGVREFSFVRRGSADTQLDLNKAHREQIKRTRALHFGTLSLTEDPARNATLEAVHDVVENGGIISFDPNVRLNLWSDMSKLQAAYLTGMKYANILKISDEDFKALEDKLGSGAQSERIKEILNGSLRLLLLTLGKEGAVAYWRSGETIRMVHSPTDLTRKPVDTTGAGDIFTGAFLSQLLAELPVSQTPLEALHQYLEQVDEKSIYSKLHFANLVAGLSTEYHGGITSIPDAEILKEIYGEELSSLKIFK